MIACACKPAKVTSPATPVAEPAAQNALIPKWLTELDTSQYLIGLGRVSKVDYPLNFAKQAQQRARKQVEKALPFRLSPGSVLYPYREDAALIGEYERNWRDQMFRQLPAPEQFGVWSTDTAYWVGLRVPRAQWQQAQAALREQSTLEVKMLEAQAEQMLQVGRFYDALSAYHEALRNCRGFWAEPIMVETAYLPVDLASGIVQGMNKVLDLLVLYPGASTLELAAGEAIPEDKLYFRLEDESQILATGLGVYLTLDEQYLTTLTVDRQNAR
ncbi:MAG: hypothetical protein AAGB22_05415, partial [Bacteroidota bacterium]